MFPPKYTIHIFETGVPKTWLWLKHAVARRRRISPIIGGGGNESTVAFRLASFLRAIENVAFSPQKKINLYFFPLRSFFAEMAETLVRAGEGDGGAVRPQLLHRREQEEAQGHHLPR